MAGAAGWNRPATLPTRSGPARAFAALVLTAALAAGCGTGSTEGPVGAPPLSPDEPFVAHFGSWVDAPAEPVAAVDAIDPEPMGAVAATNDEEPTASGGDDAPVEDEVLAATVEAEPAASGLDDEDKMFRGQRVRPDSTDSRDAAAEDEAFVRGTRRRGN